MSAFHSVIASSFMTTHVTGVVSIDNAVAGVFRKKWGSAIPQSYDNPSWFTTAPSPDSTSVNTNLGLIVADNYTQFTLEYVGYFLAPSTGSYEFQVTSDDGSYFWIGSPAVSGYTVGNANINNGGPHGNDLVVGKPVFLTAGLYYPIRLQYYDSGGNWNLSTSYRINSGAEITDFTGVLWHNSVTQGL